MIRTAKSRSSAVVPALLLALLSACASSAADASTEDDGWRALFNGRDLTGWTPKIRFHPLGENFANTFRVEDGVLRVVYGDEYATFDDRFGHLFFDEEFGDYLLRVEYRFVGEQVPGGPGWAYRNSGVMVHGQPADTVALDQEFPVSIEVQLLGGDGEHPRTTANLCTPGTNVEFDGALVLRHCTDSTSSTYHGDQWVTVEIEVRGGEVIRHSIDGVVVLEYQAPQLDERDADAERLLAAGAPKLLTKGTISLQSESHPVEFRRVELKPLE